MSFIEVSAVVFINQDLEVLTVRKHGTEGFMLPGGKPEQGESPVHTAIREVGEELGIELTEENLQLLGEFEAQALNEVGQQVRAHTFLVVDKEISWTAIRPRAEIAQIRWVHPETGNLTQQAPLNLQAIFPHLLRVVPDYTQISSLAVFCGASSGTSPVYAEAARELGALLAQRDITLVYGGGRSGIMGQVAGATLDAGGEVVGIMPTFLKELEGDLAGVQHFEEVTTMHERKARMAELADAFVALPGGAGTLEEFFEAWTWRYLGLHQKTLALLNTAGFWTPMLDALKTMNQAGFLSDRYYDYLVVADTPQELLEKLAPSKETGA